MIGQAHRRSSLSEIMARIRSRLSTSVPLDPAQIYLGSTPRRLTEPSPLSLYIVPLQVEFQQTQVWSGYHGLLARLIGRVIVSTQQVLDPVGQDIYGLYRPSGHMYAVEQVVSALTLFYPYIEQASFGGGSIEQLTITVTPLRVLSISTPQHEPQNKLTMITNIDWETTYLHTIDTDDVSTLVPLSGAALIQSTIIEWNLA